MGKTPLKLTIVVLPPCDKWPEIEVLEGQGHMIYRIVTPEEGKDFLIPPSWFLEADLILGPQCWLMDTTHKQYLNLALKACRLKRYGPASARKKKGVKTNEDDDFDNLGSGSDSNAPTE